ncbi:MAG TPA: hypothetical protein VHB99_00925 [Pirellulales bacterium]|nr:hypothetical protein [Pirellulales bacterium]
MQRSLLIAGLFALSLSLGCSGETKPGGDSAAPKFEGETTPADTTPAETAPAETVPGEMPEAEQEAAEPEMKDEAAPAEEKPAAEENPDEKPAEEPAAELKPAPSDDAAPAAEKPAADSASKRASRGIFKGLVNSVSRGAKKTMKGAKPAAETPTPEPEAGDDPFPKGEPAEKPADEKPEVSE